MKKNLVCSSCGRDLGLTARELASKPLWVCTGSCYLNWFQRLVWRPYLESKK